MTTLHKSTIHAPSINQLREENRDEFNRNHDYIPSINRSKKDALMKVWEPPHPQLPPTIGIDEN